MAEQISRIVALAYSPEETWNAEKTYTASAGSTTTVVSSADLDVTDHPEVNRFKDAMFYCVTDPVDGTNALAWRQCDGHLPASDTVYFQNDAWAGTTAVNDTFKIFFVPRLIEGSVKREDKFGDRSGYKRDNFRKYPNPYIRTEADLSFTTELTGMGAVCGYGEFNGAAGSGTSVVLKANNGRHFSAGTFVKITTTGAAGGTSYNLVTAVSTDTLTITPAYTGASLANDSVWGFAQPGEIGNLMMGCVGTLVSNGGMADEDTGAGSTTTCIPTHDATQFSAGDYIGVDYGSGTATADVRWVQVTDVTGGTVTVSPAMDGAAAPAAGDVLYNTWTVKPADTGHESFTMTVYEHAVKHVLTGCKGTFTIDNIDTDQIPQVKFEFVSGGNETLSDEAIPSDWVDATLDTTPPLPVGAYLQIAPTAANTASKEFRACSFSLGSSLTRRVSPSATTGIANISVTDWDAPTIKCQINMDTLSTYNPITAMEARTLQRVRLILGGDPGSTVIIDFRQSQITATQGFNETDGREYWDLEIKAMDPADTTSSTLPPWVIAIA